jgi:hypothetical protein
MGRAVFSGVRLALCFACAALLVGCASIVKGTTQQVTLSTPGVPGASCTLVSEGIGTKTVQTPATLVLDKSQHNVAVTCKKACYQDGVGIISSSTEGMAAGNIIAGGVIGLGIDAATGAMNKYNPDNQIAMVPIAGCAPPPGV